MEVSYKEIDELYNKYTELIDNELTKSHLEVETLQFYQGARAALANLKKHHEGKLNTRPPESYIFSN